MLNAGPQAGVVVSGDVLNEDNCHIDGEMKFDNIDCCAINNFETDFL